MLLSLAAAAPAGATDFSGWAKSARITFTGYNRAETLTNFPVLVVLGTNISGFVYGDFVAPNGGDLRFAASNGTSELNYEIDTWNTASNSYVWVQVPALSNSSDCIWAYWGMQTNAPAYTTNGAAWSNGYVGVWHMRESSGNLINSATGGTTNNGVSVGTRPTATTCLIGNGQYNASQGATDGNGFNVGNFPVFAGKSNITLETICRATDTIALEKMICSRNETGGYYNYTMGRNDSGFARMCVAGNGGSADVSEDFAPYTPGDWHYVAGVYSGITNARVAVDGLYYYDTNVLARLTITDTSTPAYRTYLFAKYGGANQCFVGYQDEVRISTVSRSTNWLWATWRTAMSNSQFQTYGAAIMQGGLPPTLANLAPTNITATSACMNGSLLATNGSPVTAMSVLWGTTDGGTTAAAWAHTNAFSPGPWLEGSSLTTNISPLTANSDCYYTFSGVNGTGTRVAGSSQYFITGALTVQAIDPLCGSNATDTATFVVTRPATCTAGDLPFSYTLSGTATNGVDYTFVWAGGSALIPAAQTNATLTISPMITVQNYLATKSIVVTLNPGNYVLGAGNSATGTFQSYPTPAFTWDTSKNGSTANFESPANWLPTNLFLNHVSQVCDMNAGALAGYGQDNTVPPFVAQLNINSNAALSSGVDNTMTFSNLHLRGGALVGQKNCGYHGRIFVDNPSVLDLQATDVASLMAPEFSGSGNLCVSNGTAATSGYLWWPFTANNTNYSGVWTFYNVWPGRLDFVGNMGTGGLNFTPMSSNVWISANTACPWTLDLRGGQVQTGVSANYPSPFPGAVNPTHSGTFTLLSDAIIRAGGPGGGVIATINGRITGVGRLGTKALGEDNPGAANAIKLGGTNDYTGGTVVMTNVLEAAVAGSLGTGNVQVQPGSMLQVDVAGTIGPSASLYLDQGGGSYGVADLGGASVTTRVAHAYVGGSGGWKAPAAYSSLAPGTYTRNSAGLSAYLINNGALKVASPAGSTVFFR